jgi:hypothetical protein
MMAGEAVDELIKAHQAAHPGMSYRAAYDAVVHAGDGDVEVEAYRDGHARYVEADRVRQLQAKLHDLAGRILDVMAKAARKKSGSDYRAAFVEVAQANPEIAKDYGFRPPQVPLKNTRRWSW